jgi:hypothetical protein
MFCLHVFLYLYYRHDNNNNTGLQPCHRLTTVRRRRQEAASGYKERVAWGRSLGLGRMTKAQDTSNNVSWAICMFFFLFLIYIISTNDFLGLRLMTGDDTGHHRSAFDDATNNHDESETTVTDDSDDTSSDYHRMTTTQDTSNDVSWVIGMFFNSFHSIFY